MGRASDNVFPRFLISEGGSTATPAANRVTAYAKSDGLLYSKDDAGVETLISGGPGGAADILDLPTTEMNAALVLAPDGAGGVEFRAEAGGAGGYPLDSYALDGTYGDHFTGAALDGKWTRRNFVSGAETYQLGKNGTYLRIALAGRAVGDGYYQTQAVGDGTYAMKFIPRVKNQYAQSWGLAILDSSGNGCATVFYSNAKTLYVTDISTYSNYNNGSSVGSGDQWEDFPAQAQPVWVYIRKSGNDYYAAYSFDGEIWSDESGVKTKTFTPAYLFMFIPPLGNTGSFIVDVDWVNKIA